VAVVQEEETAGETEEAGEAAATKPQELGKSAAAAEPEPAGSVVEESASLTLEPVKVQWRNMVSQVGSENKNLPPLLAMCKPLAVEGSTIIIGFDFPIFKEKFDKTEGAADSVSKTFSSILGTKCGVRSVVTSEYVVPIGHDEFRELAEELGGVVRDDSKE
jgi:hypothetical protein